MNGLFIKRGLVIPEVELEESFIRASGPGGQNVNKVASAVQLRFDVGQSRSLPEEVRAKLRALPDSRLDVSGVLTITARRFREQARNRADARARLAELVLAATRPAKPRLATKPTRASKQRHADRKKHRGQIKKDRARPLLD
ncbi:MAG TPA: alternative ribosome rescue aminoacyl-tRNA hydrolase ArfB [Rhizomicrobium sp.]|nr:alternative ribosome rescue aminoacyl-tRNA hydrolase ArfB [Rhizomicrobium sp.]